MSIRIRKIAVCIKQIPLVQDANFDLETKTLRRDGPAVISAFDLRAIALGVQLATSHGADTTVLTMGPPKAREALEDALAMGIARGVHLEDKAFAGSDTLATARALAAYLADKEFDLVLMGRHSLDSETGQVGPELAELLGYAQITNVRKLEFADNGFLRAERESDEGFEVVECTLPAVLTCAERVAQPIRVRPEMREQARSKPIITVRAADISPSAERFGFAGSPTVVKDVRVFSPEPVNGENVDTADPEMAARRVVQLLDQMGAFTPRRSQQRRVAQRTRPSRLHQDIWVIAERELRGSLTRATFELLSRGQELAERRDCALVLFAPFALSDEERTQLASYGADELISAEHEELANYSPEVLGSVLASALSEYKPWAVLFAASERGRDYAPRVAARLGLGLTGDAIDVEIDQAERLEALKPAFGGNIVAPIISRTIPQMVTIRPGMLEVAEPCSGREARVRRYRPSSVARRLSWTRAAYPLLDERLNPLDGAEIVVGVGMGVGGPEGVERVKELARMMGAAVCATRKVTDAGWLPRQTQVGLTGKSIAPRLYFAVGVRGAPNHTVGLKRARTVVAINNDPEAPIFERAHIRLVGDWERLLPPLAERLKARLN